MCRCLWTSRSKIPTFRLLSPSPGSELRNRSSRNRGHKIMTSCCGRYLCYESSSSHSELERLFRRSGRGARGGSISRILEKRNSLQMSQVFRFRTSVIRWASLFKDSISGTEKPVKSPDSHANCTCMPKSKDQPLPAVREEVPGLLTLNKFWSRCERGRFTRPILLPRGLAIATPRRSEARPR
jgi:hypothetical protein